MSHLSCFAFRLPLFALRLRCFVVALSRPHPLGLPSPSKYPLLCYMYHAQCLMNHASWAMRNVFPPCLMFLLGRCTCRVNSLLFCCVVAFFCAVALLSRRAPTRSAAHLVVALLRRCVVALLRRCVVALLRRCAVASSRPHPLGSPP